MKILIFLLLVATLAGSPFPPPSPSLASFRGSTYLLTVRLTSQIGDPVDNATIYFFHEDNNTLLGTSTTNQTGFAIFNWEIPLTHTLGPTMLNATFFGDPERFLLPSYIPIPVTIYAQMNISFETFDEDGNPLTSTVFFGEKITIHVDVQDDTGLPLEGVNVSLYENNDELLLTNITNQTGSTSFNLILNDTEKLDYEFRLITESLGYINGSEVRIQYSISNSSTTFIGLPAFYQPNQEICGKLCQNLEKWIANATVYLYLDDTILLKETQTNQDGYFCFNSIHELSQISSGRFLTVVYNGNTVYKPTKALIGILPLTPIIPFRQKLEVERPQFPSVVFSQITVIGLTLLAISTVIIRRKINQSSKHFVSH
jgi:hypothetical protein